VTPADESCPYVGLQPFREENYQYFFGRERDIRVIASNLREQPLTIVYGASGVGKSSALRAGVLPHLRSEAGAVPIYFNAWQSDSFLEDFTHRCCAALNEPNMPLEKLLASVERRFFLVLDQFEEFLLYHPAGNAETFDSLLARIVNRRDLAANVLIGIREDALSRFDQRFSIRIADLLANTLPLEHLNNEAARRAMVEPLRVFNEQHGLSVKGYTMESRLCDEILRQVQPRRFADHDAGEMAGNNGRVETPFLQLVLRELWDEESRAGSRILRLETLEQIGGARQIVEKHVNRVLANLPRERDREIAASMFRYLVTPSRSKIAQDTKSLIDYGEAPETEVRGVLSWLSDKPESRILRRLDTPERYEIFHDVLAQPILDWRKRHFAEKERIEERRKRRRLQMLAGAMLLLALAAVGFGLFALDQRKKAREAADLQQVEKQRAIVATRDAEAARNRAESTTALLQAKQAELAGRTEEAARFRTRASDFESQAQDLVRQAGEERDKTAALLTGRDQDYRGAAQQILDLRQERDRLKTQVTSLSSEIDRLKKLPAEKDIPPKQAEASPAPAGTPSANSSGPFRLLRTLEGHSGPVWSVAVSRDGRRAVSASADRTLKVWDESGRDVHTLRGHSDMVQGVALNPVGRMAVSVSADKSLTVWDLETGQNVRTMQGHSDHVIKVAMSPDGLQAVSASFDKTLKVWNLETGLVLTTLKGHSDYVLDVALTPDGRKAVSASVDKTLKVWNLEAGRVLRTLSGHAKDVACVAVSPDGRRAISGSSDKTLKVWDLETGRVLRTLIGHVSEIASVAVSSDGLRAVSGSFDKTLKLWDLDSGALIATYTNDAIPLSCAFAGAERVFAGDSARHVHVLSVQLPSKL
jgi:hypothetical protein